MDGCHFMSLLLVLHATSAVCQQNASTFYITSTHGYCPVEALAWQCMDLHTFLSLQLPTRAYSTSLFFTHGDHLLDKDFNVTNVENFSMSSYSSFADGYNSTDMVGSSSAVRIKCVKKGRSVNFVNISLLRVDSVSFYECGDSHAITGASMQLVSVGNVWLTNSMWLHSRGSAIFVLYSKAELSNCKFIAANCSHCCGGGIHSEGSILIFISTNLIMGNIVQADGGGMYIFNSQLKVVGNLSLIANTAADNGGGICMSSSVLSSTRHSVLFMKGNTCEHSPSLTGFKHGCGGGFYIKSSIVSSLGHMVLTGNVALYDSAGGGFMSTSNCTLHGHVDVYKNSALGNLGSGGGLYIDSGFLKLRNIAFDHNIAKLQGGAVYIGYHSTHMITSGKAKFNHNRAEFGGAIATTWGSSISLVSYTLFASNLAKRGGAISVVGLLEVTLASDIFYFTFPGTCTFVNNESEQGGALYVSGHGYIIFGSETLFKNNSAISSDGGAMATLGSVTVSFKETVNFTENYGFNYGAVHVILEGHFHFHANVYFHSNRASQNGGALSIVGNSHCILASAAFFTGNEAGYMSGSMEVAESSSIIFHSSLQVFNSIAVWAGGGIAVKSMSLLQVKGNIFMNDNRGGAYGGAIVLDHSEMHLDGMSIFKSNMAEYGGALHVMASMLYINGYHRFENNVGQFGGGWSLTDSSLVYCSSEIDSGSMIYFSSNHVNHYGGAIWVEDIPFYSCINDASNPISLCFFQKGEFFVDDFLCKFNFNNNSAALSGSNVFGGSVDDCKYREYDEEIVGTSGSVFDAMFLNVSDAIRSPVSSNPVQVCLCHQNQPDCSITNYSIEVFPGEQFGLPVVGIGQRNGTVPAVILTTSNPPSNQTVRTVGNNCSVLNYSVSMPHSVKLNLSPESPCHDFERVLSIMVNIKQCPPGFHLHPKYNVCTCADTLIQLDVQCDIDSQTFNHKHGVWIDYGPYGTSQSDVLVFHSNCPFNYCRKEQVNFTLSHSSNQCSHNRQGLLCGACRRGYSLTLGDSECSQCSHTYILLLLPLALAGVLLVVFLLALKMTVSAGTLNGLIFFANIIGTSQSGFLPPGSAGIFRVFIAWLNLDLGITTCLFDGLDMYAKTWLQFVFPLYVWVVIGVITVVSRYSTLFTKLLGHDPIAVLATLIFLSYTKFIRAILSAFAFTYIQASDGTRLAVWLYDGNVGYLSGKHIPLFLFALLVMLLLFIPYTTILLVAPWLLPHSRRRALSWIDSHRLKPFLRSYYAPLKDKYHSWVGLLLVIRFLFLLAFASNSLGNPDINFVVISVTVLFIAFWRMLTGTIYIQWWHDVLELFFITHLGFFSVFAEYTTKTGGNLEALADTFCGIVLAVFSALILYHGWRQLTQSRWWRLTAKPKLHKHFHGTTLDTTSEEGVKRMKPQVQQPVSVTFVELREPLLTD